MAIVLTFTNPNKPSTRVNIYRSSTRLDKSNLGEPIATLPGNVSTYVDETAVGGAEYFYMVEVTDGVDSIYTVPPSIINIRTRGPGPSVLEQGDRECGFYGLVKASEMPSLAVAFGISAAVVASTNSAIVNYYKFAWKGRVIYIADSPIGTGTNTEYNNLDHAKHARSGLKYNFESPALQASEAKPNIHTVNGFSFHARYPRGTPEDWDGETPMSSPDVIGNPDTEFNQLVGAMARTAPVYPRRLCALPLPSHSNINYSSIMTADVEKNTVATAKPPLRWQVNGTTASTVAALGPSSNDPTELKNLPSVLYANGRFFSIRPPVASATGYESAILLPVFELIED